MLFETVILRLLISISAVGLSLALLHGLFSSQSLGICCPLLECSGNLYAHSVSFSSKRAYAQLLSCVCWFVTPWTVAHQASLSMGFLRQEYWSGLLFLSPGDLPDPGIKPGSLILAERIFTTELRGNHFPPPYFQHFELNLIHLWKARQ